jgi:hypothetical protein
MSGPTLLEWDGWVIANAPRTAYRCATQRIHRGSYLELPVK